MRLLTWLAALPLAVGIAVVLATNVFRPAPAADRLAGLRVEVASYRIEDLPNDVHRLWLTVTMSSPTSIDECVGFTLDEPFAGRRLKPATGVCPRPLPGRTTVKLLFEKLTADDLAFPSHTLVWGIPGGRCGPILEAFGVCVVEQAGTAQLELPSQSRLPSFGPLGSFAPFGPFYSIPP
jgi:hypothetical protein